MVRTCRTIGLFALGAFLASACASVGTSAAPVPRPPACYDPGIDFDAYRTFDFLAVPASAPGSQRVSTPEVADTIARSLESVSLSRVARDPDLLVAYAPGGSAIGSDAPLHAAAFAPVIAMRDVDPGSLVVDLLDGRTRRLVWRGVAAGALVAPEDLAPALERLVRGHFPARPAFYRKPR